MLNRLPDYLLYRLLLQLNKGVDGLFMIGTLNRELNNRLLNTVIFRDFQRKSLKNAEERTIMIINKNEPFDLERQISTSYRYRLPLLLTISFDEPMMICTHKIKVLYIDQRFYPSLDEMMSSANDLRLRSFLIQLCQGKKMFFCSCICTNFYDSSGNMFAPYDQLESHVLTAMFLFKVPIFNLCGNFDRYGYCCNKNKSLILDGHLGIPITHCKIYEEFQ